MSQLRRTFDAWHTDGFVVGLSEKWVLLHEVYNCRFTGWKALRLADITSVESETSFVPRLLARRGHTLQPQPALDLTSASSILKTLPPDFPLVNIELEKLWPGTCYIGQVKKIDRSTVQLTEIDADALWERVEAYPLKEITQITLGDDYSAGLWEMGAESAPKKL